MRSTPQMFIKGLPARKRDPRASLIHRHIIWFLQLLFPVGLIGLPTLIVKIPLHHHHHHHHHHPYRQHHGLATQVMSDSGLLATSTSTSLLVTS
jgi:hypothetical protein